MPESKIDRRVFLDGVPRRSDLRMGGAIILGWRAKPPLPLSFAKGQWEVECATLGTRRAHSGQLELHVIFMDARTSMNCSIILEYIGTVLVKLRHICILS